MGAFGASVLKKYMNDVRHFIPLMEREKFPYSRISYNEADLIAIVRTDIVIFYAFLSIIKREGRSSVYHHLLHEYEELIKTYDDDDTILYKIHQDMREMIMEMREMEMRMMMRMRMMERMFTMKYSPKTNKFIFPFKNIVTAKYDIYQSVQAVSQGELTGTSNDFTL
jgi:cell division protein FtsW (lipid II flippase)